MMNISANLDQLLSGICITKDRHDLYKQEILDGRLGFSVNTNAVLVETYQQENTHPMWRWYPPQYILDMDAVREESGENGIGEFHVKITDAVKDALSITYDETKGYGRCSIELDRHAEYSLTMWHPLRIGRRNDATYTVLGLKELIRTARDDRADDFFYTWLIWQAYHESRHVWQRLDLIRNCTDEKSAGIIRNNMMLGCIEGGRECLYPAADMEIDADRYAIARTRGFIQMNRPAVNAEYCLQEILNGRAAYFLPTCDREHQPFAIDDITTGMEKLQIALEDSMVVPPIHAAVLDRELYY